MHALEHGMRWVVLQMKRVIGDGCATGRLAGRLQLLEGDVSQVLMYYKQNPQNAVVSLNCRDGVASLGDAVLP